MMTPSQFKEFYAHDSKAATLALAKVYEMSHLG